MPDLRVVATITTKPEATGEIRAALLSLAEATRREEGCRSYDLFTSAADPATFVTVEAWVDRSALDAHLATPHVIAAMAAADGRLAAPLAVHPLIPVS